MHLLSNFSRGAKCVLERETVWGDGEGCPALGAGAFAFAAPVAGALACIIQVMGRWVTVQLKLKPRVNIAHHILHNLHNKRILHTCLSLFSSLGRKISQRRSQPIITTRIRRRGIQQLCVLGCFRDRSDEEL